MIARRAISVRETTFRRLQEYGTGFTSSERGTPDKAIRHLLDAVEEAAQVASLARTALTDPAALAGLKEFDLNRIDTNAYAALAIKEAVEQLDRIIDALEPEAT